MHQYALNSLGGLSGIVIGYPSGLGFLYNFATCLKKV